MISGIGVLTYKLNVSGKQMDNSQGCEYEKYRKLIGVLQNKITHVYRHLTKYYILVVGRAPAKTLHVA